MEHKKHPFIWITRDMASGDFDVQLWSSKPKLNRRLGIWRGKVRITDLCIERFESVMHWLPESGTGWKIHFYFDAEEI